MASEQVYPHDLEMEKSVLGKVICNPNSYEEAAQFIHSPSVFYSKDHIKIWRAITELVVNSRDLDIQTLSAELRGMNVNGLDYYVTEITESVYTSGRVSTHANEVLDKWIMRECMKVSIEMEKSMSIPGYKGVNALVDMQEKFDSILDIRNAGKFDIGELVDQTTKNVFSGGENVIKFGLGELDRLTGGMTRGEITVVAGRPGQFKTTLAINMVSLLAGAGYRILVFNHEMTNEEMMKKLFVIESDSLTYSRVRGDMNDSDTKEWKTLEHKIKEKYKNLIMHDNVMELDAVMAEIRKVKPDIVIDDYIGLINVRGITDDRKSAIDTVMRKYKWAAKAYKMCAITVSQLNRRIESRQSGKPVLSDLRDSGSIEQDAEMVLFTHYPYGNNPLSEHASQHSIELILGKNRYGSPGKAEVGILGDRCKFYETPEDATNDAIKQNLIGV